MWAGSVFFGVCVIWFVAIGLDALSAGMCARRRTYFSCSHKKIRQKKCAPLAASLRFAAGNLRCSRPGCAAELAARLRRSAQTTAASQITKRMHPSVHSLTPPAALLGAARGVGEPERAIAALGPRSISAAASRGLAGLPPPLGEGWGGGEPHVHWQRCQPPSLPSPNGGRRSSPLTPTLSRKRERGQKTEAERSDGPCGLQSPSGRAERRRAWGGHGQRSMPMLRALTRCGCLNGAAQPRSEFRSAAPCPSIAGCPKGHGQRGRLFFAYFLLAKQKKVGRPPGRIPGRQRPHPPKP